MILIPYFEKFPPDIQPRGRDPKPTGVWEKKHEESDGKYNQQKRTDFHDLCGFFLISVKAQAYSNHQERQACEIVVNIGSPRHQNPWQVLCKETDEQKCISGIIRSGLQMPGKIGCSRRLISSPKHGPENAIDQRGDTAKPDDRIAEPSAPSCCRRSD